MRARAGWVGERTILVSVWVGNGSDVPELIGGRHGAHGAVGAVGGRGPLPLPLPFDQGRNEPYFRVSGLAAAQCQGSVSVGCPGGRVTEHGAGY